jgi:hypothetical protein
MDEVVGAYIGEWNNPSGFCLICGQVYVKVSQHINKKHKKNKLVQDIYDGPKEQQGEAMEQLLRDGNHFKNNSAALATGFGLFLPSRRTPFFRSIIRMVICKFCFSGVDKSHIARHLDCCMLARSPESVITEARSVLLKEKNTE